MFELPSKSPIQFQHLEAGQVKLVGRPDVVLKTHESQAHAVVPAWYRALGLPTYQEEWDALAIALSLSCRFAWFVACDESRTRHVGHWRLQPARIRLQLASYCLTLGHSGYVIGRCFPVMLLPASSARVNIPDCIEGDCLIATAELYDSKLGDIAWRGLQQGIFSHTCVVLSQKSDDPDGAGDLAEIALVSEAEASCPGAKILKTYEV